MRFEGRVLLIIAAFFATLFVVYGVWSHEWAGTAMLGGSSLLGAFPGTYYLWWSHRMDPREEDKEDGSLSEGAGVIAAFPDSSIWPFVFGMGCASFGLALVFGLWTAFLGGALVISAMIGIATESRRGGAI
ncbi:MAG: cytochrome c oxidase subunit 4 [Acidimicrobiales bacterium]|nr:cytochrome c oxidase subunit 4 [Acidimicrobiales bacterium]